jgi:hypothetical protein
MDLEENAGIYNLFLDLAPGLYRYKLIVDGVWMADPQIQIANLILMGIQFYSGD